MPSRVASPASFVALRIIASSRSLLIRRSASSVGERSLISKNGNRSRTSRTKVPSREARPSNGSVPRRPCSAARGRGSSSRPRPGRAAYRGCRLPPRRYFPSICSARRSVPTASHARELLDLLGVFGREHPALALLAALAAVGEEQSRLLRRAVEKQVRVRHLDAAEVVELVGLAEARVARGARRALEDGEGVRADRLVDLRAPRRELFGREIGGEEREALLGKEGAGARNRIRTASSQRRSGMNPSWNLWGTVSVDRGSGRGGGACGMR